MSSNEAVPNLTPNQILALVVLFTEARDLTNNELKELAGFTLTGKPNEKLENQGLIETDHKARPMTHHLTPKGRRVVTALDRTQAPKGNSAIRSLLTALANVQRSLERLQISPEEFFKTVAGTTAPGAEPVVPEARVREAYAKLAKAPGDWVGLADLRDHLTGLDRPTVDATLIALLRQNAIRIIPVANTKALKPRDRAAALRIGNEDNHTISIGPS